MAVRMKQAMRDAAMPIWWNCGQLPSAGCGMLSAGCPLVSADHWKATTLPPPAGGPR